jgi:Domain of unknown function (DUF4440)
MNKGAVPMTLESAFESFGTALVKGDPAALAFVLAEQFRFTNAEGEIVDKPTRIETIIENRELFESLEYSNIEFVTRGDTGVVFATFHHILPEQDIVQNGRSTFVFAKSTARWSLIAQHNSHSSDEAAGMSFVALTR